MKRSLYPHLAFMGIKNNRKFYLPYILSCIGMIAMYYIMHFLSCSPLINALPHGSDIFLVLSLGKYVIAIFSLFFLFYTNSFLLKRRYKEFGLYNVLGMNKKNISSIILWESSFIASVGILSGVILGIAFSKLFELGFLKITKSDIGYIFSIPFEAIIYTVLIFAAIFVLLTIKSLISIARSDPLELMNSQSFGEKPIKANWIVSIIGISILCGAYYMALSIDNPIDAFILFFVAVIMVIAGTYLIFISGSVALCKLLQKNKKYYYKKNHFISVSSMTYRMKRNGMGLASICILCTMVLVMITSTSSLYFGANDAMNTRYPRETEINIQFNDLQRMNDDSANKIKKCYLDEFEKNDFTPQNPEEYKYVSTSGKLIGEKILLTPDYDNYSISYSDIRALYFLSIDDYNKAMGTDYSLKDNEAMLYTLRTKYKYDHLKIEDLELDIIKKLDDYIEIGETNSLILPSFLMVINDYDVLKPIDIQTSYGEKVLSYNYHYGYDSDLSDEKTIDIYYKQLSALNEYLDNQDEYTAYNSGCLPEEKDDFNVTFGGLFFLGIILSVIFILAAAVIIYYKQISEGYEDEKRFEIMQNVGMTKTDIKKSINSQILTVFFAPLIFAGIHLIFAFPFVWKILQLFNIRNLSFVIITNIVAFIIFSLFYAIIYKITAKSYYKIVASDN